MPPRRVIVISSRPSGKDGDAGYLRPPAEGQVACVCRLLGERAFLSRTVVSTALARGHSVVCSTRGTSGAPPGADRVGLLSEAAVAWLTAYSASAHVRTALRSTLPGSNSAPPRIREAQGGG